MLGQQSLDIIKFKMSRWDDEKFNAEYDFMKLCLSKQLDVSKEWIDLLEGEKERRAGDPS